MTYGIKSLSRTFAHSLRACQDGVRQLSVPEGVIHGIETDPTPPAAVAVSTNIVCLQRRASTPYCETLWLHLGLTLYQPTVLGRNPPCYCHCPIECLCVLQSFLPFLRHVALWCVNFDE